MLIDLGGVAIDPSKVVGVFTAATPLHDMNVVVKIACSGVDAVVYVPGTVAEVCAKINAALGIRHDA